MMKWLYAACTILLVACSGNRTQNVPVIGFVDAFEDNTLAQANAGFIQALADSGYSEKRQTIKIIYRNAQGNVGALNQIIQYFKSQEVEAIATCPSLPTITALQATQTIPVFMMVAPEPSLMKLQKEGVASPPNLYGVGDNLDYIDSSFGLIAGLVKPRAGKLVVGMLYNQSEPQSLEALGRIQQLATKLNITLKAQPVNNSSETQLAARNLIGQNIDAFFANPDNTVFAAFETIVNVCNQAKVPVFTSEAGLVERGAVAAYGADIYEWGYQAGAQCARMLTQGNAEGLSWEMVKVRRHVYNAQAAAMLQLNLPPHFKAIKR